MDLTTFEDFIPTYPEDSDPDIQHLITLKNEFLEVSGKVSEPRPERGNYYRHQKALFRYMLYHDRMLNIQETGTGKSCSLVAIAEYFKKFQHEKEIKRVIVLEKGPSTVDEFKRQIACSCTPEQNDYITERVTDITLRERDRKSNLTRALNKWYSIKTYGNFVSEIQKSRMTDEQLAEAYSGCIFFIDEAHNLSEDRAVKERKKENAEENDEDEKQEEEKQTQYQVLWKLFHLVKRSKIILGTATPMINEVKEIAPLMNLLLPADQQMPIDWSYENVSLEQLEPFFRGKVSYVRGLDTGAQVIYEGSKMKKTYTIQIPKEDQNVKFLAMTRDKDGNIIYSPPQPKLVMETKSFESQAVLKKVLMSKFQDSGYSIAAQEDKKDEKKEAQAFYRRERNSACLVFPNKKYIGDFTKTSGHNDYIKIEKLPDGKRKPDSYILDKDFQKKIKNIDELKEMSAKYGFVVENELNPENIGNVFCFTDLVTGSGGILFGKILEEYGFKKYKEATSVFQVKDTKKATICSGDSDTKKLKLGFKAELRYGILTKEMSDGQRASLLELFNSYENRNGEYCKILIGTPVARDGINVFNVRRGYLLSPSWHPSGMHQALSRFIRSTSHEMLIQDERQRLLAEGKDPSMASVSVKIYKLAAIRSEEDTESVDLRLYQITEEKDIHIRRMMRFLKQCAFDCPIHYERNIRKGDIDGTAICDYTTCKYKCARSGITNKVSPKDIDFTSYDILYSKEIVEQCKNEIKSMMKMRTSVAIGCLYSILGDTYKRRFIDSAVESIVTDRLMITDRFGYPCFINTNGFLIYTQGELPLSSQSIDMSDLSYYKDTLVGNIQTKFDLLIGESAKLEQQNIIDKIKELEDPFSKNYQEFTELVNKLTETKKIEFIEKSSRKFIQYKIKGKQYLIGQAITKLFKNYIIVTFEPKEDIINIRKYLESAKFKPGRNRKETDKPIVDIEYKGPPNRNYIYPDGSIPRVVIINTYTGDNGTNQSYNAFTNFKNGEGEIHINVGGETLWRKPDEFEYPAYKNIIKQHALNILKKYSDKEEFGLILPDNKFRIIKTKNLFDEGLDTRIKEKGKECKSYDKIELIDILIRNNYKDEEIDSIQIPSKLNTKNKLIEYLIDEKKIVKKDEELEKYTLEELKYIYKWSETPKNKESLCDIIGNMFISKKLMFFL
jgi:hypothetical protein